MAEPEKLWTRDDFKEYVHKELNWSRIDLDDIPRDGHPIPETDPFQWIFWSREQDDSDTPMFLLYDKWDFISHSPNSLTLKEKVRIAIRKLLYSPYDGNILVQFWTFTTTSDGRTLLTTQGQPFGLTQLSNPLCEYRMICKDYKFYVDGMNGEEDLGIPGRVYLNKCPECTPDVEYYSVKEYPQRHRTLRCGVRQSLHLPVIKDQSCVGVLELVGSFELGDISDSLYAAFQGLDLECFDSCEHHETREKNDNEAHKDAFNEIERVLKLVSIIYKLPLARTWVPCGDCTTLLPIKGYYDVTMLNIRDFSMVRLGHHLRNGIGVVGRTLSSPNLLYCSDVTQLSMAEYPLAHFARKWKLKSCFAISLQSNCTGKDVYVLEIFLPPSNKDEDPLTSLSKILETMKKEFITFTLASGEVLGKELSVEVIEFQNGQKHHYVKKLQVTGSLPGLEPLQNRGERMQVGSSDHQLIDAEQCEIDVNHPQELGTRKTSGRKHKNTGVRIKIPYEDIMHYSKLSRCDAAKNLQVSITTLQRACREYGIPRWPPRNVDKVRPPQPSHADHQVEVPQLNSNLPSNQASASIARSQPHNTVMPDANTVNVKAKYVEDLIIMFPLSLSSTLEDLYDCIESGLHLSCATYHACYIDGDNDKITITCDQGLQLWLRNSPRSPGSNAVILNIDPISQVHHTKSATSVSYIDCFPASLRPYILHVKDVALDGNCGFRAIAGLIGIGEDGWVQVRIDLLTELNSHVDEYKIMYGGEQRINELTHCLSWFDGFPGMDRWMTLPDMGHLIASCYNVVLYLLSHQQCLTFLPLRSVPIPATSRREITIGFVNNNHFVEVFLLPGHPVPPVVSSWTQYRYQCAQGWDTAYNRRIQHFRELVGYNVATTDAISLD